MEEDLEQQLMRRALRLATKGRGRVSPNPLVGAVIFNDGEIVGEGFHEIYGGPHAEVNALRQAGDRARGGTVVVTLEPCCHQGKTPPCTNALIAHKVRRVVVGTLDPNPEVNGKGVGELRRAGIDVRVGVLEEACRELNRGYFKWIRTGLPWVTAKLAVTLDGKIATQSGDSKWITSERARRWAHRLRAEHDAVLIGSGTLRHDDPQLTVRHVRGPNPWRIVADPALEHALRSRLATLGAQDGKTIVAAGKNVPDDRLVDALHSGLRVWSLETDLEGKLDPLDLLMRAAADGLTSVLLEGGAEFVSSFVKRGLVDRFVLFVAPRFFGEGIGMLRDLGVQRVADAHLWKLRRIRRVGTDLMLELEAPRQEDT